MELISTNIAMALVYIGMLLAFLGGVQGKGGNHGLVLFFFVLGQVSFWVLSFLQDMLPLVSPLLYYYLYKLHWHWEWYNFIYVGPFEEGVKLLFFALGLYLFRRKILGSPLLLVVLALSLGLGFGFLENILAFDWVDPQTMRDRSFRMIFHGMLTSIAILGYGLLLYPSLLRKNVLPGFLVPLTMVLAMVLHACFNLLIVRFLDLTHALLLVLGGLTFMGLRYLRCYSPHWLFQPNDRPRALVILEESLNAEPGQSLNRLRMAVALLAGGERHEADEASTVLQGLPDRVRSNYEVAVLEELCQWTASAEEHREKYEAMLRSRLLASPKYRAWSPQVVDTGLSLEEWLRAGKVLASNTPAFHENREQPLGRSGDSSVLLSKTLRYHLGRLMAKIHVPFKPRNFLLPDFAGLDLPALTVDVREKQIV